MQDEYVTFSGAWFTLSLINAGLAQGKKRSGLNWWLVSLLLGPVATLLIVVWPPGSAETEPRAGRMSQRQALIIGGAVILLLLVALGAARFLAA